MSGEEADRPLSISLTEWDDVRQASHSEELDGQDGQRAARYASHGKGQHEGGWRRQGEFHVRCLASLTHPETH